MAGVLARPLLALALLVPPAIAAAQGPGRGPGPDDDAPTRRAVAVELGRLRLGIDDAMASPLRYRGTAPAVALAFREQGPRWRWTVSGGWSGGRLTSRRSGSEGGTEEFTRGRAAATLVRRVWGGGHRSVWLGPGLAGELGVRRHLYTPDDWLSFRNAFVALQAVVHGEVAGRAGGVTGSLALPVLGVAVRPGYAGVPGSSRVQALPPGSMALVRYRIDYLAPLGSGALGARAFLDGTLTRHGDPDLSYVANRFGLGLEWRVGS